jgi:hypothetical protein
MIASCCLAGSARTQDNPILSAVKDGLKDPTKPFAMGVIVKVKDGQGAKFEAAFAKALKATRQEKGCIAYDLNRDVKELLEGAPEVRVLLPVGE